MRFNYLSMTAATKGLTIYVPIIHHQGVPLTCGRQVVMYITVIVTFYTQLVAREGVTTIVVLGNMKSNVQYWPNSSKKFGQFKV